MEIEEYRENIEARINEIMPKVNFPLLIIGFLLTVSSATPILVIGIEMNFLKQAMSNLTLLVYFLCFVASFFGYMLIHRSTEHDWL